MRDLLSTKSTYSMTSREFFDVLWEKVYLNEDFKILENEKNFKTHVLETSKEFIVYADIPGVDKQDLTITYENNFLVIAIKRAEAYTTSTDTLFNERYYGETRRMFYVPDIKIETIRYTLEKGELALSLQKDLKKSD